MNVVDACRELGIPCTKRQMSKWRRGWGLARGVGRDGRKLDPKEEKGVRR